MGGIIMNENLNLCEILKDCPTGTKFWSSMWGDVYFSGIKEEMICITVLMPGQETEEFSLLKNGKFYNLENAECIIFPSKDQRDWSKFKVSVEKSEVSAKKFNPEELKPFDKILIRDGDEFKWVPSFFDRILKEPSGKCSAIELVTRCRWEMCIPYNDETKHLLRTKDDCPDYYKWWEE